MAKYVCQYCGRTAKSSSGHTLHLKSCKKKASGGISKKEIHKEIKPETKPEIKQDRKNVKETKFYPPKNISEWVEFYYSKYCDSVDGKIIRGYLKMLFRMSPYSTYKNWSEAELNQALERIVNCQKSSS